MQAEVPVIVRTPLSLIVPPVVTDKLPVTVTVFRLTLVFVLSRVKLLVPVVVTNIGPERLAVPNVMLLLPASIVKDAGPDAVNTPLSVIAAPALRDKLPATLPWIASAVVPPSMVTLPDDPCVVAVTAPVNALVAVSRVMS